MRPSRYNIDRRAHSPSAELTHQTTTYVPAEATLRPLRDVLIVEPFEHTLSAIIAVIHEEKPVRGIVKAAGPGCYPKRYNHAEKHRRTKVWDSRAFRPTEVRVGDTIEFGGFAFDSFYWGERLHLILREEDVCGIRVPDELDARSAAQHA